MSRLQHKIESIWYRPTPPPFWLRPLAHLFGWLSRRRRANLLKRQASLPVPVIVVGNISVGGTGKSPIVAWLVQSLREMGLTPGIVARGYGGKSRHWPRLVDAHSDAIEVGDEPVMLAGRLDCPVSVGPDRLAAARALLDSSTVDVIVSDDGLQHYAMPRQFEIAVVDGLRGLGNAWLLPAGPLREAPSRLTEVDVVLVNGGNWRCPGVPASGFHLLLGDALALTAAMQRPLDEFRAGDVHAVAGIGHPERFFTRLEAAGLSIIRHDFPDHHQFCAADLAFDDTLPVLMTEKDAVKCAGFAQAHWWRVPAEVAMDAGDARRMRELLSSVLRDFSAPRP